MALVTVGHGRKSNGFLSISPRDGFIPLIVDEDRLRRRDLKIGYDVRVAAFLVARVHGSRGIAVGRAARDARIGILRAGIQCGVDPGEASTRIAVHRAIDVIAGYARRRARVPRKINRVCGCGSAGPAVPRSRYSRAAQ